MTPNYDDEVDFALLAVQDDEFARYLSRAGLLDFQNPDAVKQLTISLLKRDFGLTIELPDDRLCPPVPVRYHYIRWIQALLESTSPSYSDGYDPSRDVVGLDIGTGASAIYPLIACSLRQNWRLVGTDIDRTSLEHADRNIKLNQMENRVKLLRTDPSDNFYKAVLENLPTASLDFTMCNPPFYASEKEMSDSQEGEGKSAPPSAICTGSVTEMVTKGGDTGFVLRMFSESAKYRSNVQWFSSMFGKLDSVKTVVAAMKETLGSNANLAVTCLRAGKKTKRWAVAWSWQDLRPSDEVARGRGIANELCPVHTEHSLETTAGRQADIAAIVDDVLDSIAAKDKLHWRRQTNSFAFLVFATENVWSRAARRKQQREKFEEAAEQKVHKGKMEEVEDQGDVMADSRIGLVARITVESEALKLRWLRGKDYALVESFWGMLVKRVQKNLSNDI